MHCTQDINVLVLCIPLSLDLSEDGDLFAETFKRVQAYIWLLIAVMYIFVYMNHYVGNAQNA